MGGRNPPEKAYFRSTTVSAVREDWVVVCAVICEPVSPVSTLFSPVLPLKGANFAGSGARLTANHLNHMTF